jgi:D-tyrosyl-tRNA(Tyr) deacylase
LRDIAALQARKGETQRVRAVIQRVSHAEVTVEGAAVAACGPGLLVFLGVATGDGPGDADRLALKVSRLRIFESDGKFDRSIVDSGGEALVVSQFTLISDSGRQKGARPDFSGAAPREVAEPLYQRVCDQLRALGVSVETGVFGAKMQVELVNDGPVTIILDV